LNWRRPGKNGKVFTVQQYLRKEGQQVTGDNWGAGGAGEIASIAWDYSVGRKAAQPGAGLNGIYVIVWALNDICNDNYGYKGARDLERRGNLLAEFANCVGPTVIVIAGSGTYWGIKGDPEAFERDKVKTIREIREQGHLVIDGMPFFETVESQKRSDGWHYWYSGTSEWPKSGSAPSSPGAVRSSSFRSSESRCLGLCTAWSKQRLRPLPLLRPRVQKVSSRKASLRRWRSAGTTLL
jgi:hypothetical protein